MLTDFTELNITEFIEDDGQRYFLKRNASGSRAIKIKYAPIETSNWSEDNFEIFFFENGYLNAENDVYEIDYSGLQERIGWIFPITILESNDNDYENYKNLNHYKFIAYKKMMDFPLIYKGDDAQEYYNITDFFQDCKICILCKMTIDKIPDFDVANTLLSFYNYGYLLLDANKNSNAKAIFDKSDFINSMRSATRKKIVLSKAGFDISSQSYISALYQENLLQSESHLIRFFFLYQVIEYLMQLEYDKKFNLHLQEYADGNLSKNDFKEQLNGMSKERELIRIIFNKCDLDQCLINSFVDECEFLFDVVSKKVNANRSVSNMVYDLRNLITHQLRDLTVHDEQLKKIIEIFERLLTSLLINLPA